MDPSTRSSMFVSYALKMRCSIPSIYNSCTRNFSPVGPLYHRLLVQRSIDESMRIFKSFTKGLTTEASDEGRGVEPADLIAVQKRRAIARWEEAYSKKYFNLDIYDRVLKILNEGEVPPIYHTLCRDPSKRLFLPNTFVSNGNKLSGKIEFSANRVEAGFSSPEVKDSIDEADLDEFSYLDAFFAEDGHGFANVCDTVFEKYWKFNKKITSIVTDLVNSTAKMIGHDMEVTELPSVFPVDVFNGENLITRSLSRGVVGDCFEHSKPGSTYAIVGSPGIGKSWSLIYALQQALLFENSCVVFCFQKDVGEAWVCIRKNNHIYAWYNGSYGFERFRTCLFKNESVLALLDPKEAVDEGGASYSGGRRRLIFAASLNKKHFKNVGKGTPNYEKILNPYSSSELKVALKYMPPPGCIYTDDDIAIMLDRAKEIGYMPRYVLSQEASRVPKTRLLNYLTKTDFMSLKKLFCYQGLQYFKENDSLAGGVFALYASGSISDDFDDVDNVVLREVGYDGDTNVDYSIRKLMFPTDYVKCEVAMAYRDDILSYGYYGTDAELSMMRDLVEALFWSDMEKNIQMKCFKMSKTKGEKLKEQSIAFYFAEAEDLCYRPNIWELDESFFEGNKKCRMRRKGKLFDVAFSNKRIPHIMVFQVIGSRKEHSMSAKGMKALLIASGILQEDSSGAVFMSKDSKPKRKIYFYWVVPYGASHIWNGLNIGTLSTVDGEKGMDLVKKCFNEYVVQFVIVMDKTLIELAPCTRNI